MQHNYTDLVDALRYIAARKCDCAKLAKEAPPCSHQKAKDALVGRPGKRR